MGILLEFNMYGLDGGGIEPGQPERKTPNWNNYTLILRIRLLGAIPTSSGNRN